MFSRAVPLSLLLPPFPHSSSLKPRLQVFPWIPPLLTHPAICSEVVPVSLAWWRGPGPGVAEPKVIPISKSRAASQQAPYGGLDRPSSEQRGIFSPARGLLPGTIHHSPACSQSQLQTSPEPGRNLSAFTGKEAACHRSQVGG